MGLKPFKMNPELFELVTLPIPHVVMSTLKEQAEAAGVDPSELIRRMLFRCIVNRSIVANRRTSKSENAVLKVMGSGEKFSRPELVKLAGVSMLTVRSAVKQLLSEGLIQDVGFHVVGENNMASTCYVATPLGMSYAERGGPQDVYEDAIDSSKAGRPEVPS